MTIKTNSYLRSPLRYPGCKQRAVKTLQFHFDRAFPNAASLASPFVGGGSFEITLAQQGVRVYAYGGFPHLVGFWQVLQEYGGDAMWAVVMEVFKQKDMEYRAAGYAPKHWFSRVQEQIERIPEPLYRAAAIFYLNRRSFSGTTESGGCSSTPSRFLYTNINTLRRWPRGGLPGLTVDLADFRESLARHPDIPAYLDPPYLVDSALYGKRGDKHKGFNHGALARILKTRPRWMLSYNDCPEVRELYKDFDIIVPDQWNHSMSKHKKTSEVIILNP